MSRTVERYIKRVRKKLIAGTKTKAKLTDGLRDSIAELGDEPSYDDLIRTFGTPAQAAAELQHYVDEDEVYSERSRSKRTAIMLGVVSAILILILASYMWYVDNDTVYLGNKEIIEISDYAKGF